MSGQRIRCSLRPGRQAGVSLVTAIFLMVVLAALGVAIVGLVTRQQASAAMDERGARAYQAARAGIEWGLFQQLRLNSCQPSAQLAMPATAFTLNAFTVTVRCVRTGTPASGAFGASLLAEPSALVVNTDAVEVTSAVNAALMVDGMRVAGPGIMPGTQVAAIAGTTLTLTNAASAGGGANLDYFSPLDRWQVLSTACTEPDPGSGQCPNPAPTDPDYVQRQVQVEF